MRLGSNPFLKAEAGRAEDVTVTMTTYIPHLSGYFAQRLQVLELSIESIRRHTDLPYDLFVFDNGSCPEVRRYLYDLYEKGVVQYVLFSRKNLGVLGAFNLIAAAAPGKYISYSDDDILYYPGWLQAQLAILEAFPDVGMVSGLPTWKNFDRYTDATRMRARENASIMVETSQGWPRPWVEDYCTGTGRDPDQYAEICKDVEVLKLSSSGVSAFATATHCQFVVSKDVVRRLLPFETGGRAMYMNPLDKTLDGAGLMRLSTTQPYIFHMGNRLSPRVRTLASEFGLDSAQLSGAPERPAKPILAWLLKRRRVRKLLRKNYSRLFEWMLISEGRMEHGSK